MLCRNAIAPGSGADGPAHQIAYKRTRPAMDQQLRNWQMGPVLFEIYSRLYR